MTEPTPALGRSAPCLRATSDTPKRDAHRLGSAGAPHARIDRTVGGIAGGMRTQVEGRSAMAAAP